MTKPKVKWTGVMWAIPQAGRGIYAGPWRLNMGDLSSDSQPEDAVQVTVTITPVRAKGRWA